MALSATTVDGAGSNVIQLSLGTKDFVAGALGGIAGVLAGQPLDTVRIRLQQPNSAYTSALQCWRHTVTQEGPRALFKGMAYPVSTVALQNAVTFHAFGAACRMMGDCTGQPLPASHAMLAGMAGGVVSTVVQVPVDVLKIRLQLQRTVPGMPGHQGPGSLAAAILRRNGLAGLYRGTCITLLRDVPSYGLYFCLYEASKSGMDALAARLERPSSAALHQFLAGGIAGVGSWCSVYPFDVVKSRIQATCWQHSPYAGWVDCMRRTVQLEGPGALVRGMAPSLVRAFVVNAAIFAVYEATLTALP